MSNWTVQFLPRVSTLTRDIDIAILSVCLSVCLSVRHVPVLDENRLTYCHNFFTIRYPNHSSFIIIKHLHEILMASPPAGALNTGGYKNHTHTHRHTHTQLYSPKHGKYKI